MKPIQNPYWAHLEEPAHFISAYTTVIWNHGLPRPSDLFLCLVGFGRVSWFASSHAVDLIYESNSKRILYHFSIHSLAFHFSGISPAYFSGFYCHWDYWPLSLSLLPLNTSYSLKTSTGVWSLSSISWTSFFIAISWWKDVNIDIVLTAAILSRTYNLLQLLLWLVCYSVPMSSITIVEMLKLLYNHCDNKKMSRNWMVHAKVNQHPKTN